MKRVRTVVAEDEPPARESLIAHLETVDWIELAGTAAHGAAAVEIIDRERPELVFLDVHMPELSGMQVLERIEHNPAIVFTTAFDQYAVTAFELSAVDYLLKPFGRRRLMQALQRVRARFDAPGSGPSADRVRGVLEPGHLQRLFARDGNALVPVTVDEIVHASAADDYAMLHVGTRDYLVHVGLGELVARLDPERFLRVHRSHVVNIEHIVRVTPHDERRLVVHLSDSTRVLASRTGSQALRRLAL